MNSEPQSERRSAPGVRMPDAESRAWVARLHGIEPVRRYAIAELHERLHREARFEIRKRTRYWSEFPASDIDDLAVQAADDALMALLRKLDDYRGDSQFWTWAKRFVQLEALANIRHRFGHDHLATTDAALMTLEPVATGCSPHELVERHLLLEHITASIVDQLTPRQRTVVVEIAINGVSPVTLASQLETTPGAIYKTLHDARERLKTLISIGD